MKAIETRYNGYRFRSRLEARWAVFFDALELDWEYEKEGYDLDESGPYLPDFWLPDIDSGGMWVEVKPTRDEAVAAWVRMTALSKFTVHLGAVVYGYPIDQDESEYLFCLDDGTGDYPYKFCVCPWCERVGFEHDGRGARVCGYRKHYRTETAALAAIQHLGHWRADDKCYTSSHTKIVEAAYKARAARFEFGAAVTA
jgi:hypothetical protein